MIQKIDAQKRYHRNFEWLEVRWLFSFADYYDPDNVNLGALRVFNDDLIQPGTGFGKHPHKEMEIVSIILDGELTHEDNMGNKSVIKKGEVQRMSAGTGVIHSEHNDGDSVTNLYQIWINPDEPGQEPSYEQKDLSSAPRTNTLLPVVSGKNIDGALTIHSDSIIYVSELEEGNTIDYAIEAERHGILYVNEGKLDINGETYAAKDQSRIDGEEKLVISAPENSSFILLDLPGMPEHLR
jgi:redox-sensitive bicupin YhaK (pirin superfamily)